MILRLPLTENARLDKHRLAEIVARLGVRGADEAISRAMEELAVQLARVHRGFSRGNLRELGHASARVEDLAARVGMPSLAKVARDVCHLSARRDGAALAATVARLERIGESSLMTVWDIQDISG